MPRQYKRPIFQHRQYEMIAAEIRRQYEFSPSESGQIIRNLAEGFADIFRRDNKKFDASRFYRACGFG